MSPRLPTRHGVVTTTASAPRGLLLPVPHRRHVPQLPTSRPLSGLPPAAQPSGLARLRSRRVVRLAGPDAARYLQGAVTAAVLDPTTQRRRRDGFYAAFLNAQGRVRQDVFVHPVPGRAGAAGDDEFLIDVDAAEAPRLAALMERYRLRARFESRVLDEGEAAVYQAWNDHDAISIGPESGAAATLAMPDRRAPALGYRILRRSSTGGDVDPDLGLGLPPASEDAFRIRRYLAGVPEGRLELVPDSALPLEGNLDIMGGVDFRKGCYVGQELTIRTRHRGVVRKRVLPCVVGSDDGPEPAGRVPPGTSIGRAAQRGRSAGRWLAGVGNLGLALCRLEIMTDVALPGEPAVSGGGDGAAAARENECVMEWGSGGEQGAAEHKVKVRALVPDWMRRAIPGGEWWGEGGRQ